MRPSSQPQAPDQVRGEELFLAHIPLIEHVIKTVCRRNVCHGVDAEEFESQVKLKLIENDYAVLEKFRGESHLGTYLTTVIGNLFRDYRIRQWGKWRPSAKAKRLGETAIQLEQLLYRDGRDVHEAIEILKTNYRVTMSSARLEQIASELPVRQRRRLEGEERLRDAIAPETSDQRALESERRAGWRRAEAVLSEAIDSLPDEDRMLLRMRFWSGFKVSRIASITGIPQRQLYSRYERLIRWLRRDLEARGLSREDVAEILLDGTES